MKKKWEKDFSLSIDRETWNNIFNICFKDITNNNLTWFQMKILYRILATKTYLFKLRIKQDNLCERCKEEETLLLMFAECNIEEHFWHKIENLILEKTGISIKFTSFNIILGYLLTDQNRTINALILVTKKYICDSVLSKSALNFHILKHRLEEVFTNESLLSKLNNTENIFNKKWGKFKRFL